MAGPFGVFPWGPVRSQDGHMHMCGNMRGKCRQEATDQRVVRCHEMYRLVCERPSLKTEI